MNESGYFYSASSWFSYSFLRSSLVIMTLCRYIMITGRTRGEDWKYTEWKMCGGAKVTQRKLNLCRVSGEKSRVRTRVRRTREEKDVFTGWEEEEERVECSSHYKLAPLLIPNYRSEENFPRNSCREEPGWLEDEEDGGRRVECLCQNRTDRRK